MNDTGLHVLWDQLAEDLGRSINDADTAGVEFANSTDRKAFLLGAAVISTKQIGSHPKFGLCQRLLSNHRDDER